MVSDVETLTTSLKRFRQGDCVFVRILREENLLMLQVTLDLQAKMMFDRQGIQNRMGGDISIRRAGFDDVIQHDTVLKPHQCGGAVVDLSGKAIGVNIARAGRTESFALPASIVRDRIDILKSGRLNVDYTLPEEVKSRVHLRETETAGAATGSE
jgi:serine protease Do